MQKTGISIPPDLIVELEAWGQATTRLFGKLRVQAGLPPKGVPRDQAWFWLPRWQAFEQQVDRDLQAGQVATFDTVEALIADLDG